MDTLTPEEIKEEKAKIINDQLVELLNNPDAKQVRDFLSRQEKANLNLNVRDLDGYAPIHHLAKSGITEDAVALLIEFGADANLKSADGKTALEIAEASQNTKIVSFLKTKQPATSPQQTPAAEPAPTPASVAKKYGIKPNDSRLSFIYIAAIDGKTEAVKELAKFREQKTLINQEVDGYSPTMAALYFNHDDTYKALLGSGATPPTEAQAQFATSYAANKHPANDISDAAVKARAFAERINKIVHPQATPAAPSPSPALQTNIVKVKAENGMYISIDLGSNDATGLEHKGLNIADVSNIDLTSYTKLTSFNLGNNKIKSINEAWLEKKLPQSLKSLDMEGNPLDQNSLIALNNYATKHSVTVKFDAKQTADLKSVLAPANKNVGLSFDTTASNNPEKTNTPTASATSAPILPNPATAGKLDAKAFSKENIAAAAAKFNKEIGAGIFDNDGSLDIAKLEANKDKILQTLSDATDKALKDNSGKLKSITGALSAFSGNPNLGADTQKAIDNGDFLKYSKQQNAAILNDAIGYLKTLDSANDGKLSLAELNAIDKAKFAEASLKSVLPHKGTEPTVVDSSKTDSTPEQEPDAGQQVSPEASVVPRAAAFSNTKSSPNIGIGARGDATEALRQNMRTLGFSTYPASQPFTDIEKNQVAERYGEHAIIIGDDGYERVNSSFIQKQADLPSRPQPLPEVISAQPGKPIKLRLTPEQERDVGDILRRNDGKIFGRGEFDAKDLEKRVLKNADDFKKISEPEVGIQIQKVRAGEIVYDTTPPETKKSKKAEPKKLTDAQIRELGIDGLNALNRADGFGPFKNGVISEKEAAKAADALKNLGVGNVLEPGKTYLLPPVDYAHKVLGVDVSKN